MARIIAIASGKGGVGKTMLTANLGLTIAKSGKRVVMLDADLDMANLELSLGMEGRPITLQDVLNNEAEIQDTIYDVTENAKFVPAGISPSQFKRVDPEKLANIIRKLEPFGDYILLDCPAGIGRDTIACFEACKETILVTTTSPMSVTDAFKTKKAAEKMGSDIIGVVINMMKKSGEGMKESEISSLLQTKIIGRVPYDEEIRSSIFKGKPYITTTKNSNQLSRFSEIAFEVTGEKVQMKGQKKSLFDMLFGFLKKR